MSRAPILPGNPENLLGVDTLMKRADEALGGRIDKARKAYADIASNLEYELVINAFYAFRINQSLFDMALEDVSNLIDFLFLEGGAERPWFSVEFVEVAYRKGASMAFTNLKQQMPTYGNLRQSFAALMQTEPFRMRVALVRAREFEEMRKIAGDVKADLTRVLTDGMARGLNPRTIAENLTAQTGILKNRAERIARTEIPGALRRARREETVAAMQDLGVNMRLMHLSALSPTTRISHAQRHAKLFTVEQVDQWYSQDGNAINCRCSQSEILVDDKGVPVVPDIIRRAEAMYERVKQRSDAEWAKED